MRLGACGMAHSRIKARAKTVLWVRPTAQQDWFRDGQRGDGRRSNTRTQFEPDARIQSHDAAQHAQHARSAARG